MSGSQDLARATIQHSKSFARVAASSRGGRERRRRYLRHCRHATTLSTRAARRLSGAAHWLRADTTSTRAPMDDPLLSLFQTVAHARGIRATI
jgi:hypothetical protein